MTQVTELTDANYEQELKGHTIAVVDVYASWCGSCRLFAPAFAEVAADQPKFAFYKTDGEKNPKVAALMEIDNLPFVAVFNNGEFVGGKSTTKKEALLEMIETIKGKIA